jgi:hypothetical protein
MTAPPAGWSATPSPGGGVDLRVSSARRGGFLFFLWALALVWTAVVVFSAATHRPQPLDAPPALAASAAVLLVALAGWTTLGDELWHLDRNVVEHRVGIAPWMSVHRFSGGELQIVMRFTGPNPTSVPYYRLYAVCGDGSHFLMERGDVELERLQTFIAAHTSWHVRERG